MNGSGPGGHGPAGAPASWPEHLLFDLDDTLYSPSTGFFRLVATRIRDFIRLRLGLEEDSARALQRRYWKEYGTSLRGLMVNHGVEPEPFLQYVHDLPVETLLAPDPALRGILVALGGRRHIFTNGPEAHVRRVLRHLRVDDLFERVFDIASLGYVPKPNAEPYAHVERALKARGAALGLVDDAPANLPPARARGWWTVLLRAPESWVGGAQGLSVEAGGGEVAHVVIEGLGELPAALARLRGPGS